MKYIARYLRLSMRRAWRAFPTIALLTVLMCAGVLLTGVITVGLTKNDDSRQRVRIGVVGDMSDSYFGVGLHALQNIDDSRYMIELIPIDSEKEAKERLESNVIGSYILIPDGFVDSIVSGENEPLTYVMKRTSAPLGASLMGEVARAVSALITESQTGVSAVQEYCFDLGLGVDSHHMADDANYEYIALVLSRGELVEKEITGGSDSLGMYGCIFCGAVCFFLMLWGITCSPLLVREEGSGGGALARLMESKCGRGGALVTSFGDWSSFFALAEAVLLVIAVIGGVILSRMNVSEAEFRYLGVSELVIFVLRIIPAVAALTSFEFLLFEVSSGVVGSILLQFTAAAALGYVSGFFYPVQFFPESVQRLSAALPSGAAFTCVRQAFSPSAEVSMANVSVLLAYTALFFGASVLVRRIRMLRA